MSEPQNLYTVLFGIMLLILVMLAVGAAANSRGYTNGHGVRVVDGDTVCITTRGNTTCYRMWGMDAPEAGQTATDAYGREYEVGSIATNYLRAKIGERPVRVVLTGGMTYGRPVARLYVDNEDLGAVMVRDGYAFDYRKFSGGAYAALQQQAMQDRVGMWQGSVEHPAMFRAKKAAAIN